MLKKLLIESVVHGGLGLSHQTDGKVIFVPYVLENEEVEVSVTEEKKDFNKAILENIIKPSPDRIEPSCIYYEKCGGCQLQHTSYSNQLIIKKKIFTETLKRSKLYLVDKTLDVIPSSLSFSYRHSMRFKVDKDNGAMGLAMAGTNNVVPIKSCLISMPEINIILEELPKTKFYKENFRKIKEITIESSLLEKKTTILLHIREKLSGEFFNTLPVIPSIKNVCYFDVNNREKKIKSIYNDGQHRLFPLPITQNDISGIIMAKPGSFVQNNWDINLKIIKYIQSIFKELAQKDTFLDLHTGIGNYLFPASPFFKNLVGSDVSAFSIDDCSLNARNYGISASIYLKSAKNMLIELIKENFKADCIILDPPRGGCPEIINLLPLVLPETIIYISCDPPALARDLKNLIKFGFGVVSIRLFDMFPQTYHLETVTVLRREK